MSQRLLCADCSKSKPPNEITPTKRPGLFDVARDGWKPILYTSNNPILQAFSWGVTDRPRVRAGRIPNQMEMPPPPYQGIKKLSKFVEQIRTDPVARTAWFDKLEQGERDLIPIQERLDALTGAQAEGWTPTRVVENELGHLNNVICGRYVAKYLADILSTLQEAEADLATWPGQRAERLAAREREEAEAEERRQKQAEISKQQDAFYSAFFAMGISPIPMGAAAIAESARALNDIERQISNMGNHLYE
jgi:hypothetical protein